jgi:tetratricopeptide (TPR) repeat protein
MIADVIDSLWDYSDPAKSESKFRDLLARLPSDADRDRAEVLTQISRACCLQRHHKEAEEALALCAVLWAAEDDVLIRRLLEHGRLLHELRRTDEALADFQRAWDLACRLEKGDLAVDAAHMLAYVQQGEAAVSWNRKALLLTEKTSEPRVRRWQYRLLCNLGRTLAEQGDFAEAQDCFDRAADYARKEALPLARRLEPEWRSAQAMRRLGRAAAALEHLKRILGELPSDDTDILGYVSEDLGECLLDLGQLEQATPFFARAWELHRKDPWFPPTEASRLERIRRLAGGAAPEP